jgi:translation initiation factor eIF-2B subunit alpha
MSALSSAEAAIGQQVLADLTSFLSIGEGNESMALPVAAMKALLEVIRRSGSNTMMGLQEELRTATRAMLQHAKTNDICGFRSNIPLTSGCELFMRYVTRCFLDFPDFRSCIREVLARGEAFAGLSQGARNKIAEHGAPFIQDGQTVLTHGYSRVVSSLLIKAKEKYKKNFSIIVLEGRPECGGLRAAQLFAAAGIPATVVLDAAMGHFMERADLVVVGAEGVVENGGVVNKVGTYALALAANALGTPVYVAAESYKFARLYPLNQADLPAIDQVDLRFVDTTKEGAGEQILLKDGIKVENPPCDYTPAKYITLLFTDLGVLTPSAVSDELIRLYQ